MDRKSHRGFSTFLSNYALYQYNNNMFGWCVDVKQKIQQQKQQQQHENDNNNNEI